MKSAYPWVCLVAALVVAGVGLLLLNDVRGELRRVSAEVNTQLPAILEKTRASTDTLAELAGDIRLLRELSGASAPRDQSLVAFADHVLDAIAATSGKIGTEKLIGKALKNPEPAATWVVGARREALLLTLRVKSREQLLEGLCKTALGATWYIQLDGAEPMALIDWVRANVSDATATP